VPRNFDAPQWRPRAARPSKRGLEVVVFYKSPPRRPSTRAGSTSSATGTSSCNDLGGGTSTCRSCAAGRRVPGAGHRRDNYLGGDDLDRRFAERLRLELCGRGYALDLDVRQSPEDAGALAKLMHVAQEIKSALSTREVVHVSSRTSWRIKRRGRRLRRRSRARGLRGGGDAAGGHHAGVLGAGVENRPEARGVGTSTSITCSWWAAPPGCRWWWRKVIDGLASKSKNAKPLQDEVTPAWRWGRRFMRRTSEACVSAMRRRRCGCRSPRRWWARARSFAWGCASRRRPRDAGHRGAKRGDVVARAQSARCPRRAPVD